ncbi:MAG: ParA family protein [Candidatus Hodarchaeota archaeon]
MKTLSILSHKGGVGKTSVAVNLAVYLANEGMNVCLIDNDFHGPAILTFFEPNPKIKWINGYLMGQMPLEKCLQDISSDLGLPGKLLIAFADPTPEAIQNVIQLDANISIKILHFLMNMKKLIKEDPYSIDYLIIDSSPGAGLHTVNLMVVSDAVLFMVKLTNADLIGTSHMINGLYQQLKSRTMLLANQVPQQFFDDNEKKERFQYLIESLIAKNLGEKTVEFLGWLPNDLELFTLEFETALKTLEGEPAKRIIHTLDKPDHIISNIIKDLALQVFGEVK